MSEPVKIALDAMGGDHGPCVVVPGALSALEQHPNLHLILVGNEDEVNAHLVKNGGDRFKDRISVRHASQKVEMDESPATALRSKKDSSMRVALNLVKENQAAACVSAGNTGALMAIARFVLKTLPGIDRPAIMKTLPTDKGVVRLLDLGANVDCSAENLFEFGVMGSVYAQAIENMPSPRVALLNVGHEEIKGSEEVKKASAIFAASPLNYTGYVEGNGIFFGEADVIVCDGFVGNVSLKVIEGLAKLIALFLQQEFKRNIFTKLAGLVALPVLKQLKNRIDPGKYNGASLLGLKGIVLKSHGGAGVDSFACAITSAVLEVEKNVPALIHSELDSILSKREAN
ncbi:MAG: phosphate acyltransferase PlsX [Gammaproteobacteria bacterium]|nr:MAG: phosphate acyltransferase PlsX [Gammaproteobacteria bacterium]